MRDFCSAYNFFKRPSKGTRGKEEARGTSPSSNTCERGGSRHSRKGASFFYGTIDLRQTNPEARIPEGFVPALDDVTKNPKLLPGAGAPNVTGDAPVTNKDKARLQAMVGSGRGSNIHRITTTGAKETLTALPEVVPTFLVSQRKRKQQFASWTVMTASI